MALVEVMHYCREGEFIPEGLSWGWSRSVWGLTLQYVTKRRQKKYYVRLRWWFHALAGPVWSPMLELVSITPDGQSHGHVWRLRNEARWN